MATQSREAFRNFFDLLALSAIMMVQMIPPVPPRSFAAFGEKSNVALNSLFQTRSQKVQKAF